MEWWIPLWVTLTLTLTSDVISRFVGNFKNGDAYFRICYNFIFVYAGHDSFFLGGGGGGTKYRC